MDESGLRKAMPRALKAYLFYFSYATSPTKISFSRADMDRQIIQAAYTKSLYGGMERTNPRPYSLR